MEVYLRALIAGEKMRPRPPNEYAEIRRQLAAIGNNINQIARTVNARGFATKEDTAAKKENARAPSENSSKERGTGARASTEPATEKADARPSVRSRLMALQAAAERDGTAPTKDTVREAIQKAMPTRE